MESANFETVFIRDKIAKCKDIDALKKNIFPMLKSQQEQWALKIESIIRESGCTKTRFAQLVGVSRMTVNKWCNGSIPRNRETFLKIGMTAGYDTERLNQLLVRYGRYPALYSKSLEDCICIFVIGHDYGESAVEQYVSILNRIKEKIIADSDKEEVSTFLLDRRLSDVADESELENFIQTNISVFSTAYHKLYAYIWANVTANYEGSCDTVYEMALGQGWSSSLTQCVSAVRQYKWYPTRNKIISLGLHLNMDHEQIDEMLEYAHMEPLCAKNVFESVIIFVLEGAYKNGWFNADSEEFYQDNLSIYAKEVLTRLGLPEFDSFVSELSGIDEDE